MLVIRSFLKVLWKTNPPAVKDGYGLAHNDIQDPLTLAGWFIRHSCHLHQHTTSHDDSEQVAKYGKDAYMVICVTK